MNLRNAAAVAAVLAIAVPGGATGCSSHKVAMPDRAAVVSRLDADGDFNRMLRPAGLTDSGWRGYVERTADMMTKHGSAKAVDDYLRGKGPAPLPAGLGVDSTEWRACLASRGVAVSSASVPQPSGS